MKMQVVLSEAEFQTIHWKIAEHVTNALDTVQVDCVNRDTRTQLTHDNVRSLLIHLVREAFMKEMTDE